MASKRDSNDVKDADEEVKKSGKHQKVETTDSSENGSEDEAYDDGGGGDEENVYGKYECKQFLALFFQQTKHPTSDCHIFGHSL